MRKNKKLIVGNWKMNPQTLEEAKKTYGEIKRKVSNFKNTEVYMCVPNIYIHELWKGDKKQVLPLGAQNVYAETAGAFTGEVGPVMLREIGTSIVIIGHSERRMRGETDTDVNKKILLSLKEGLRIILCIGEKARDSEGEYLSFIREQLKLALQGVSNKDLERVVVAYEPVWAIGKTDAEAMKGQDVHEMVIFIKKTLGDMYPAEDVQEVKILYGGSVSALNTLDIVGQGHVDGLLVGRQSLFGQGFLDIVRIVDSL
ncbi:MAG: hypothetical protein RJA61_70 [Candidatus Parcubacteria bacterium]|jgi:triosephosphate isomerase